MHQDHQAHPTRKAEADNRGKIFLLQKGWIHGWILPQRGRPNKVDHCHKYPRTGERKGQAAENPIDRVRGWRQGGDYEGYWESGFLKKWPTLTLGSLGITLWGVFVSDIWTNMMHILLTLKLKEKTVSTKGMIDSGAGEEFVNYKFAV